MREKDLDLYPKTIIDAIEDQKKEDEMKENESKLIKPEEKKAQKKPSAKTLQESLLELKDIIEEHKEELRENVLINDSELGVATYDPDLERVYLAIRGGRRIGFNYSGEEVTRDSQKSFSPEDWRIISTLKRLSFSELEKIKKIKK